MGDFNTNFSMFRIKATEVIQKERPQITVYWKVGNKYIKVITETGGSKSAYAFIDKLTGDIFLPACWSRPAKHVRSNINDSDYGMSCVGAYGIKYRNSR